jgi:O-acetyl-ADP-ribose deacetylase (regulator of RNase III)
MAQFHRAAGPELLEECRTLGGCKNGRGQDHARISLAGRYVIHTVGPVWHGGTSGEPDLLASCYRRSLALAAEKGIRTLAFPCISTGVYGYPIDDAASIAVRTVLSSVRDAATIDEVLFCCFSPGDLRVYEKLLR